MSRNGSPATAGTVAYARRRNAALIQAGHAVNVALLFWVEWHLALATLLALPLALVLPQRLAGTSALGARRASARSRRHPGLR